MTKQELTQKLKTTVATMRAMLDKAKGEKRGLTAPELEEYNRHVAATYDLQGRLDAFAPEHQRVRLATEPAADRRGRYQDETARRAVFGGAEARDMMASAFASGGSLVPGEVGRMVIDGLHASSVFLRAGGREVHTRRASLELPVMRTDPEGGWLGESQEIPASDAPTGSIIATPKKLGVRVEFSNELRQFAEPDLLDLLFQRVTREAALRIDKAVFEGSGTSYEPAGLKVRTGIPSHEMGANGAQFADLDEIADAIGALQAANATPTGIICHPTIFTALSKLKEGTADNNKPLLQDSAGSGSQGVRRAIYGVPVHLSSQLSVTETQGSSDASSSLWVAEWPQVVLVRFADLRIEVDSSRLFHKDQSELRLVAFVDICVLNEAAIYRLKGITTS